MDYQAGGIDANGQRLWGLRWGDRNSGNPFAVLVHGTGFCAATWRAVAEALADEYVVYALDRRGHGRSTAPGDHAYELLDFAHDLVAFIEALKLSDVYAIGHSAGGADVLLAATLRPDLFSRLFVMEPPVADPDEPQHGRIPLPEEARVYLRDRANRRAEFLSREDAFARFVSREPFNRWREDLLREYIAHGMGEDRQGIVRLCCDPDREVRMLEPILRATHGMYPEDWDNPFAGVRDLPMPVAVSISGDSPDRYHRGATVVRRLLPQAKHVVFGNTHHNVPEENPEALVRELRAFADT